MGLWMSKIPDRCQINDEEIQDQFVSGAKRTGTWAIFCLECHKRFGVGLGANRGQLYKRRDDGRFVKIKG